MHNPLIHSMMNGLACRPGTASQTCYSPDSQSVADHSLPPLSPFRRSLPPSRTSPSALSCPLMLTLPRVLTSSRLSSAARYAAMPFCRPLSISHFSFRPLCRPPVSSVVGISTKTPVFVDKPCNLRYFSMKSAISVEIPCPVTLGFSMKSALSVEIPCPVTLDFSMKSAISVDKPARMIPGFPMKPAQLMEKDAKNIGKCLEIMSGELYLQVRLMII